MLCEISQCENKIKKFIHFKQYILITIHKEHDLSSKSTIQSLVNANIDSILPLPGIGLLSLQSHLAVTVHLVELEVTFVNVTVVPCELSSA